ncbi:MAG: hypothetical protein J6R82_03510 [Clostridia bacterium]|nr:hypothetical protein [Clostridia bacterium]
MKNTIRLIAMLILSVILFTSCSAFLDLEEEETKEPVFAYRPDLEWLPEGGGRVASPFEKIRFEIRLVEDESALYPVEVYVDGVEKDHYIPEAYLEQLGWEELPEDAWKYICDGVEGRKYYAATAEKIYDFSVVDMLVACDVGDFDYSEVQVYVLQLEQETE